MLGAREDSEYSVVKQACMSIVSVSRQDRSIPLLGLSANGISCCRRSSILISSPVQIVMAMGRDISQASG